MHLGVGDLPLTAPPPPVLRLRLGVEHTPLCPRTYSLNPKLLEPYTQGRTSHPTPWDEPSPLDPKPSLFNTKPSIPSPATLALFLA